MAEPCALWVLLLRKFALGKLSAIEVQELAAAAVKSGLDRTEIRGLQSLGAMGHQPGNAHRDMLRKHLAVLASPEPWKVKCDLVLKEDGKPVEKELETAVMLPHLWVLCAQENELLHSITCTNEELAVFWKSQMKSPQMTQELKRMIEASEPSQLPIPYLHPSLTWTYGSESYMGFIVQMAASCTHGTPSYKVPEKVCQKFRMMFHLYLKGYIAMEEA